MKREYRSLMRMHQACVFFSILGAATALAAAADMPDRRLTPGAVADTNTAVVCAADYAQTHRHVSARERDAVYREYGIVRGTRASSPRHGFVIDHLIPIEAGGSNDIRNLWPEHRGDAKRKDEVENAIRQAVCVDRTLTLKAAQAAMAHDWQTAAPPISVRRR